MALAGAGPSRYVDFSTFKTHVPAHASADCAETIGAVRTPASAAASTSMQQTDFIPIPPDPLPRFCLERGNGVSVNVRRVARSKSVSSGWRVGFGEQVGRWPGRWEIPTVCHTQSTRNLSCSSVRERARELDQTAVHDARGTQPRAAVRRV